MLRSALVVLALLGVHGQMPPCTNGNPSCDLWGKAGACKTNREYMMKACSATCDPKCGAEPDAKNCRDSDENCASWAAAGECTANAGYMTAACPKSCNAECGAPVVSESREAWELEILEEAQPGSAVIDTDAASLMELAADSHATNNTPVVVWFYAPWCKQCKLARPGFEAAAKADAARQGGGGVVYARLDCVAHPNAKEIYGVNSYPSFKVLRGGRHHRWLDLGRDRSEEAIRNAVAREVAGPFEWVDTVDELRRYVYPPPPDSDVHPMDRVGRDESVVIAVLPPEREEEEKEKAQEKDFEGMYAKLASGCSARFSPFPYLATTDPNLIPQLGLPHVPVGHVAMIQLQPEPDSAPVEEQKAPRLVSTSLVSHSPPASDASDANADAALCNWTLGHRFPRLIEFDADPMWAKRAAHLGFVTMHALLFLSPPHKELASAVRAAAARFERGSVVVMTLMMKDMDGGPNAIFKRYGINSILDTPKLVFLDQRIDKNENRQVAYDGDVIDEAGVTAFLRDAGLPEEKPHAAETKDEL